MTDSEQTLTRTLTLEGGKPWGFRIVGGADMKIPLQVQQILSAKAKNSGILKEDKIIEINGKATASLSHNEAKNLIVDSGNTLKLLVERTLANENKSNSATSSASSRSVTAPISQDNVASAKPSIESPNNAEIKPKVSLNDNASEQKFDHGNMVKKENETTQQSEKNRTTIKEDIGPIVSSEIKSPFLKHLITTGVDQPVDKSFVKIQPPTATYTPTKPTNDTSNQASILNTTPKSDHTTMTDEKVCAACQSSIEDSSYISASDKYYHKPHFCCSHCGSTLVGKAYFEDKDKKVCCQQCISKGGGDHCKICNKPIHGSFLTVNKDCYHDDCFTCTGCKKSLKNEPFIFVDGKPKCERCYEEVNSTYCIKCNKPIKAGESFVEVESGNCHSKCFTCKICKSVLTSFKMRDGYAICPKH